MSEKVPQPSTVKGELKKKYPGSRRRGNCRRHGVEIQESDRKIPVEEEEEGEGEKEEFEEDMLFST